MTVNHSNDRLTIEYYSVKLNIFMGFISFALAIALFWGQNPDIQQLDTAGILWLALIVLWGIFVFAYTLVSRPDTATFDRETGELTILHRKILSRMKEAYPISDIIAVLLVVDNRVVRAPDDWADIYVSLKIRGKGTYDSQNDKRLRITSGRVDQALQGAKAEKVASFLGLTIENETIEASPAPKAIDQH